MGAADGPVSVYQFFDASGSVIYVGATQNPEIRFYNHRTSTPWFHEVDTARTIVIEYPAAWDARQAEAEMILLFQPRHNRAGVDGAEVGHIPYPATRPDGWVPAWFPRIEAARVKRDAARAEVKAAVLEAVANGSSVRKLAAFTGLSTSTISRWKRGE